MKLKSYFSATVEAAMDLARRELGDEALLVNARPSSPETRHLGAYEVVFGLPPGVAEPAKPTNRAAPPPVPLPIQPVDRFSQDLTELRLEIKGLKASVRGPSQPSPEPIAPDATLGVAGCACAVVALVGPPGAGKTTTLIKLAAQYGLGGRKRTQILSADVHRIGAADQLRALASILGVGCEVVATPLALAQAIEEHGSKQLVLIDTPGTSIREMEDIADLAHLLASHSGVDTHLVLPASMQPAVLARIAGQYALFQPKKLIFTRIDELAGHSDLVGEAARCLLPVSFLCGGQRIPDDIEPATTRSLTAIAGRAPTNREPRTLGATA